MRALLEQSLYAPQLLTVTRNIDADKSIDETFITLCLANLSRRLH